MELVGDTWRFDHSAIYDYWPPETPRFKLFMQEKITGFFSFLEKLNVIFIFKWFTWFYVFFVTGIFTQGHLGQVDIIFQYIHCDEIYEAINILSGMNWDTLGHECFISMCAIVNHLLRQKLTPEREGQI